MKSLNLIPIKQALISVSDKTGLYELASALQSMSINILSTGGTASFLKQRGINVTEVSDYTGFPEMLEGRVKTLHPKIHGALLARRENKEHMQAIEEANIGTIDLLIVNLYPFEKTVKNPTATFEEIIDHIDIGGPAMLRAASKNYAGVAVVTNPGDYVGVVEKLKEQNGALDLDTRFKLAQKAFACTAQYDATIARYLSSLGENQQETKLPSYLTLNYEMIQPLRYGENPHQQAAFYREVGDISGTVSQSRQLQGKELSLNNFADTDAAWECVKTFDQPACVVVKHANPCGVATGLSLTEAYYKAFETDPTSAFGGIFAYNRIVDIETAEAMTKQFVEVVVAPGFAPKALEVFKTKPSIRLLEISGEHAHHPLEYKQVKGGLLVQITDDMPDISKSLKIVTKRKPTDAEMEDLLFAWKVAKYVKSNAIVLCGNGRTLGIGAGQMSRVDSAKIAVMKAQASGLSLRNSVVASDAFFPFRDGLEAIAQAGAKAVIQPGGSLRDQEVINAADELNVAMIFTGIREFRH